MKQLAFRCISSTPSPESIAQIEYSSTLYGRISLLLLFSAFLYYLMSMLLIVVDLNYILNMAICVGVVNSLTHYTKCPFRCINCGFNLEFFCLEFTMLQIYSDVRFRHYFMC